MHRNDLRAKTYAIAALAWLTLCAFVLPTSHADESHVTAPLEPHSPFNVSLSQLEHRSYLAHDGAPTRAILIAQTSDGFMWFGGESGLTRFDGVHFDNSLSALLPSTRISALYGDLNGDLWIGYSGGGFSVLHQGKLTNAKMQSVPPGSPLFFVRSANNTLWLATVHGLGRLRNGRWEVVGPADGYTGDGPTWIGSINDHIYMRDRGGAFLIDQKTDRLTKVDYDTVWREMEGPPAGAAWDAHNNDVIGSLRDSSGAVWIVKRGVAGLLRYRWSTDVTAPPEIEHFEHHDGLGGLYAIMLFLDRESNVWVTTEQGVDYFLVSKFTPIAVPNNDGLLAITADHKGGVMVATGWQVASYLKGNDTPKVISQFGTTNCMTTDLHGVLWSKTNDAVVSYDGSTAHSMPPPEAVVFKDSFGQTLSARCQSIAVDNTGDLWISFVKTGTAVFRYSKGTWLPNGGVTGLPQETATRILNDENGRVWLGYTNNRLAVIDHGRLTLFSAKDGLNVGNIYAITVRGSHVWIGGDTGVDYMTSPTEFRSLQIQDNTALRGVSGIVETAAGDLWLNATNGVYRFKSSDIQTLWHTLSFRPSFELFTNDDGLNGNPTLMWPGPTMVQSTDGRIWVTLGSNVSWIDPSAIRRNALAPTIAIDTLTAGSTTWRAGDVPALAPLTRDVRIAYASGSLTQPQRIRFKYRMDGLNDDWQDAGTRREASYTNLSPGNYRFRVMAFNEDGVASPSEATLNFMIEPAFYQTNWFRFFVAAIVLVMLWQLYQWRLRALERRYQQATDERIAERERIARDLHDTLLQGMQGILMQVDAWAKGNDLSTNQRESASSIEKRMRSVLIEGRDAIRLLRQSDIGARDLAGDLRNVGYEAVTQSATQFSLQVEGDARALFPTVADEVFSIVREAISNACRHANAKHLDVTLTFSAHALKVSVIDDGIGISNGRLEESQKEGHWGIAGMSERARQLGGRLIVGAAIPHGTVLTLSVPGRAAYATHPIIVLSWLRRCFGSRVADRL